MALHLPLQRRLTAWYDGPRGSLVRLLVRIDAAAEAVAEEHEGHHGDNDEQHRD